jgi:integrase
MLRDDRGLYLEIMPNGRKYWRLRYWEQGKENKISLGEYPLFSLKDARGRRDEIRLELAHGVSPRARAEESPLSFETVAREWHEKNVAPKAPPYAEKVISILHRLIFPSIGSRGIRELTAPEILAPLRLIEAQGHHDTAHTALQVCGQIFRYAIASGYADRNPAADLRGALAPVVTQHRAALIFPKEIAGLLRAIDAYHGSVVVKAALWFSAYTFQRPGEIRGAAWEEIDIDAAEWRIPAERMKMGRNHIVPLSRQALGVLERLRPLTGAGTYVFPSARTPNGSRPMSENAVRVALRIMGFGNDDMSAHGFRSMASTNLNEQGFHPDIIERQLAHIEQNGVRAAYNYAEYLPERRRMMQFWADWLDGLLK